MSYPAASQPARRGLRPTAVNLAIVTVTIIVALIYQSASSPASSSGEPAPPGAVRSLPQAAPPAAPTTGDVPRGGGRAKTTKGEVAVSEADGALPDGVTVFDEAYPGVANLQPDLLRALRHAATDAADNGIDVHVNSGWRSPAYQDALHREAVARYGSEGEAARWVATADTSAHVSGDAVDVGPIRATDWLSRHGARYGLCQVYANESWHFELRPTAATRRCPHMYADSAHDPNRQP
jgi:zinc D-Ala-D-Ala carboxypeptidase